MCVPVERELWREQDRVQYHEFSADRESTVVQKTFIIFVLLVFAVLLLIVFVLGYGNCVFIRIRKLCFSKPKIFFF